MNDNHIAEGINCREAFKQAYENRYTWPSTFSGYRGLCEYKSLTENLQGKFQLDKNLKIIISGITNELIYKSIFSQLWEVSIHRVYRPFESVHCENTFLSGETTELGTKVIVGGKCHRDLYRIKDNVITMVYRNIRSRAVKIYTDDIIATESGYLSRAYTSQYYDPHTSKPTTAKSYFIDKFQRLYLEGPYVLIERSIKTDPFINEAASQHSYLFNDLNKLD